MKPGSPLKLPPWMITGTSGTGTYNIYVVESFDWKGRPLMASDVGAVSLPLLWLVGQNPGQPMLYPRQALGYGAGVILDNALASIGATKLRDAGVQNQAFAALFTPGGNVTADGVSSILGWGAPWESVTTVTDTGPGAASTTSPVIQVDMSKWATGKVLFLSVVNTDNSGTGTYVNWAFGAPDTDSYPLTNAQNAHLAVTTSIFNAFDGGVQWRVYVVKPSNATRAAIIETSVNATFAAAASVGVSGVVYPNGTTVATIQAQMVTDIKAFFGIP